MRIVNVIIKNTFRLFTLLNRVEIMSANTSIQEMWLCRTNGSHYAQNEEKGPMPALS